MAYIKLGSDGMVQPVKRAKDEDFMKFAYREIACTTAERVRLPEGFDLWVDEEANWKEGLPFNAAATLFIKATTGRTPRPIFGEALLATVTKDQSRSRPLNAEQMTYVRQWVERMNQL